MSEHAIEAVETKEPEKPKRKDYTKINRSDKFRIWKRLTWRFINQNVETKTYGAFTFLIVNGQILYIQFCNQELYRKYCTTPAAKETVVNFLSCLHKGIVPKYMRIKSYNDETPRSDKQEKADEKVEEETPRDHESHSSRCLQSA